MRNCINILGNDQIFPYIIEYTKNSKNYKGHNVTNGADIYWCRENDIIRLFEDSINYYRDKNDWYDVSNLSNKQYTHIPELVYTTNIKVYIPTHSISTYVSGIKYALSLNTWINGKKIDLGTYIFRPTDTYAVETGVIKGGNNEYYECIDFDIIDPFYLTYADEWVNFRHNVCGEPLLLNNTGASLQVSLYVVDEYNNRYLIKDDIVGGCTSFSISDISDYLTLSIDVNKEPFGIKFNLSLNEVYNDLMEYLSETYCIDNENISNIYYELIIKSKDSIIIGPKLKYVSSPDLLISYTDITNVQNTIYDVDRSGIGLFFNSWENFEDGWSLVGSLTVYDNDDIDIISLVSNEIPITQEVFSQFVNGGMEKIIDINDMNIHTYNVVNKITNEIVQIERPNESKTNILQPVFFRVKDTEVLTLHPVVTENISINLDDYKSKVEKFVLLIEGCRFEQIGANKYGILFKIGANRLPATAITGVYYILNENDELVTTGKYNCIR